MNMALPIIRAKNRWAWWLAFTPLLGKAVGFFWLMTLPTPMSIVQPTLMVLVLGAQMLFFLLDRRELTAHGVRGGWMAFGCFLPVVYLFFRARYVDHSHGIAWSRLLLSLLLSLSN